MKPIVSIIMGSTSDLPVMEKAAKLLDEMQVPFEMNALSAHRTPEAVEEFAKNAADRGILHLVMETDFNVLLYRQLIKKTNVLEGTGDSRLIYLHGTHASGILSVQ